MVKLPRTSPKSFEATGFSSSPRLLLTSETPQIAPGTLALISGDSRLWYTSLRDVGSSVRKLIAIVRWVVYDEDERLKARQLH